MPKATSGHDSGTDFWIPTRKDFRTRGGKSPEVLKIKNPDTEHELMATLFQGPWG
jgi:hypothetical protein